MQTIIPLISRPALGAQYAGQTIEIELVRQPAERHWASVNVRARVGSEVMGQYMRALTAAEVEGFKKAGRDMAGIIGVVGVSPDERRVIEEAIAQHMDGVAGSKRRPVPVAIATQADYADDPEVQAAWAKAHATGEKAHVRTWLDDVDRPDIESNQEFVDLYVEPDGKMSVVVRPVY